MVSMMARVIAGLALVLAAPAVAQTAKPSPTAALEKQCAASNAVACWQLGEAFTLGRVIPANPARAFTAFSKACDLSIGEACFIAAQTKSDSGDQPGAFSLYRKGCEVGSGDACLYAAIRTETGRGTTADMKAAMVIYDRACVLREGKSCHYMAQLWTSGENPYGRADSAKGLHYAALGCEAGHGEACGLASYLASGERGAPRDMAASARYASMGCNLNHFGGCMQLGYAASQRREWTEARKWYARACQLSDQQGSCKAERDIGEYLVDKSQYDSERARWDAAQKQGADAITRMLAAGDYEGALDKASYGMGSIEQVNRVLIAASDAGRLGEVRDIYFIAFQTWQLSPRAKQISENERRRRLAAERAQSQVTYRPSYGSSGSSWTPSTYSAPAQTYAAVPRISESEIYRNARESTNRSYCSAGWGCR